MASKMGDPPLGPDPTEEDIDALFEKLGTMGVDNRRKTLLSLAGTQSQVSAKQEIDTKPMTVGSSVQTDIELDRPKLDEPRSTLFSPMYSSQSQGHPSPQVLLDATPRKIKNFSGNTKPGPGETDYRHWRRAAQRILDDRDLSRNKKQTILLQSLTDKAEDCIDLMQNAAPEQMLKVLDATFGSINDGQELLIDYYQLNQGVNESTSEYLTRLYIKLCEVVTHEGLDMMQVPEKLVRQFMRGTTDEDMLLNLRLDDLHPGAKDYPSLIARIRREEGRRTERRLCLRKVRSNTLSATPEVPEHGDVWPVNDTSTEVQALRKRVAELEAKQDVNVLAQRVKHLETSVGKSTMFCFRCGKDGHVAYDCTNSPNKELAEEKRAARRRRSGNEITPRQKATAGGRM